MNKQVNYLSFYQTKMYQAAICLPIIVGLLLLTGCNQIASPASDLNESDLNKPATVVVRKSPNDSRTYRFLSLPNQLRVLLVSDTTTQKAAAALTVYRGSFHEPEQRPGLAHFLEHMLFIQTHTYPEIDGFQHHISGNGGSSNAYTALDHTNYFFDITPAAFPEALDRFAHFFIDPMLSKEYAEREKNAVHSEYQMQLKDDGWRGYMVGKQALNPKHPGSRFTIGSLDTLAGDIHEDLINFFQSKYSSDQMGLVILSGESLDEIQAQVAPLFSQIVNKQLGPDYPNVPMYTDAELPAQLQIQTQKQGTHITYNFPLPNTRQHYKKKPELYFSNLIGHEGPGSLYQLLNAKGWVESLGASVGELDRNNSMMSVQIELTALGMDQVESISDLLFRYIDLLKDNPPQASLYDEQALVAELGFRFQEKSNPLGFVYQMAPRLDEFPAEDLLVAAYLMEDFDAELIQQYLGYLRPDNLLMEVSSPEVNGTQTEPWFQVPYSLEKTSITRQAIPDANLYLPPANPFLPENLSLLADDSATITQLIDEPGIQIWQDTDVSFGGPRSNLYLELAVAQGLTSPRERAMSQVYRMLVEDQLSAITYPAFLAGLGYGINVTDAGFEVSLGGYQDKQIQLLGTVLSALQTTPIDTAKFDKMKASIVRDWRNTKTDRPFSQAFTALTDMLRSGRWPRQMLVDAITPVTAQELLQWRNKRLSAISIQGLMHGNVADKDLLGLATLLKQKLPIQQHDILRAGVKDVDQSLRLDLAVDHNDAAMVIHLQDPDDSFASRAKSSLAAQLLHNAYFSDLRTEQQLGYVVSVTNRPIATRGGVSFVVQSPVKGPAHLEQATKNFLTEFVASWPETIEEEFTQQKAGLISRLTEAPKNLNELSSRYWSDLNRGYLNFDSRAQVATLVSQLSKQDMQQFFTGLLDQLNNNRLIIYSQGQFENAPSEGTLLDSAVADWPVLRAET